MGPTGQQLKVTSKPNSLRSDMCINCKWLVRTLYNYQRYGNKPLKAITSSKPYLEAAGLQDYFTSPSLQSDIVITVVILYLFEFI